LTVKLLQTAAESALKKFTIGQYFTKFFIRRLIDSVHSPVHWCSVLLRGELPVIWHLANSISRDGSSVRMTESKRALATEWQRSAAYFIN